MHDARSVSERISLWVALDGLVYPVLHPGDGLMA
jgi:hypothetical protein